MPDETFVNNAFLIYDLLAILVLLYLWSTYLLDKGVFGATEDVEKCDYNK